MSLYQFLKVSLDPFGYIVGRANSFQGISGRLFDFFLSELTNSIWLTGLIFIRTNSQLSLASFVDPQLTLKGMLTLVRSRQNPREARFESDVCAITPDRQN